jgi:Fic family protein
MMFLISEVHPFLDGNGRIARVMMNAELTKEGQSKIIIPTVFRDDYMGALRRLTRQSDPDPYIRMLQRAHEFSSNIFDEDMNEMEKYLKSCDAFKEHNEGKLKIIPRD